MVNRSSWLLQNEVIVPVSMAPLQKEIYRSLLSKSDVKLSNTILIPPLGQNLSILRSLAQDLPESARTATSSKVNVKANMNNVLMQLRKLVLKHNIVPVLMPFLDAYNILTWYLTPLSLEGYPRPKPMRGSLAPVQSCAC